MKKILMFALFVSYVNAGPVLTQEAIYDGMLNGISGVFKELTGQNDKEHEENCKKEYKKLYERNSQLLKKEKDDNIKLREIARINNVQHEKMKIKQMEIRRNGKCSTEYMDYFKATNHEISQLNKENTHIKLLLSKQKINYTPLLKSKTIVYAKQVDTTSETEREDAKEELKRQMAF